MASSSSSSTSTTLIHFLILASIFLPTFNFCSAHHSRRMLALEKPSTLQFGSGTSSMPAAPAEGDALLPKLPINSEESTLMPSPPAQQEPEANITPSFFPLPGLPSLPKFPPFPFIPTLPFAPGFDTIPSPADPIPPPPIIEP